MHPQEVQQKIDDLLSSGQGENTYIATYMMVHHYEISLVDALKRLVPIEYERNYSNPNDFYCSIRIANIWIEYESIEGYVPYMGTAATTSRVVGVHDKETHKTTSLEGLSDFLPIEDSLTKAQIKELILEDYNELIPTIIELLEKY